MNNFFLEKNFCSKTNLSDCLLDKLGQWRTWGKVFGGWNREIKVKNLDRPVNSWTGTKLVLGCTSYVVVLFFFWSFLFFVAIEFLAPLSLRFARIIKSYWLSSFCPKVFFVCFVRRIQKLVVELRQTEKKNRKKN